MPKLVFGFTAIGALASVLVACSSSQPLDPGVGVGPVGGGANSQGNDGAASSGAGTGDDDSGEPIVTTGDDGGSSTKDGSASGTKDSGSSPGDDDAAAGDDAAAEAGSGSDGTVTRNKCTNAYGTALTGSFGRLDGYVVSIVAPSSSSNCNGDTTHIHIQVSMNGAVYDVAVNVDGGYWLQKDVALPAAAWSEGWHSDSLNYASGLGIHSTDFTAIGQSALVTALESALASANHISAYGTTYTGSDTGSGIHDIHFESTNKDGALFLDPTESTPHGLFFRFSGDTF